MVAASRDYYYWYGLWLWLDPQREADPKVRRRQGLIVGSLLFAPLVIAAASVVVLAILLTGGGRYAPGY